jgi:hypothetical protein
MYSLLVLKNTHISRLHQISSQKGNILLPFAKGGGVTEEKGKA